MSDEVGGNEEMKNEAVEFLLQRAVHIAAIDRTAASGIMRVVLQMDPDNKKAHRGQAVYLREMAHVLKGSTLAAEARSHLKKLGYKDMEAMDVFLSEKDTRIQSHFINVAGNKKEVAEQLLQEVPALQSFDEQAARSVLRRVLELDHDCDEARLMLGVSLCIDGRIIEAASVLEKINKENLKMMRPSGEKVEAHIKIGRCLLSVDQYERGCKFYEQALALDPEIGEKYHKLIVRLVKDRRYDLAEALIEDALYLDVPPNLLAALTMKIGVERGLGETYQLDGQARAAEPAVGM